MLLKLIAAAILFIAPQVGQSRASIYARYINTYASRHKVDPFLVVAIIQHETNFRSVQGKCKRCRRDWGLMQLHVDKHTHAEYRGKEKLLLQPKRNIRLGVRLLAWWRAQHRRKCKRFHRYHWWVKHYKYGYHVPHRKRWGTLLRIYNRIRKRVRRL